MERLTLRGVMVTMGVMGVMSVVGVVGVVGAWGVGIVPVAVGCSDGVVSTPRKADINLASWAVNTSE
jgi:hypothetical protein